MTQEQTKLTDEQKDDNRFKELNEKPETDRTDEEKKEIGEIKERYGKRMQKRIDELTRRAKTAEEGREELEKKAEELEVELKELKNKPEPTPKIKEEVVEIAGKKFFADETLIAKVKAGEITEQEAYRHQRLRDKFELKTEVMTEIAEEKKKQSEVEIRAEDQKKVLKEFPHFNPKNPNHNPDDPLYKMANKIFTGGYHSNPKGLSESIALAKQVLGIKDTPIDRSEDFSLEASGLPEKGGKKKEEPTLTEAEKEAAVRIWCLGGVNNPLTGRPYTESEALHKALEAKKARL